eukprot:CAMPEP_0184997654 /NCGR_PEP_ID=MMETSP1098-20130426/60165_1 /TAXON_ID=89044 /ORGANISM="Spumella elongata, Strain CCAP 955/1" /LENGTH=271 /DNA_ID=CAMNT_0027524329 /DNA_START=40 /DNA_END=855 /DNA_ORIENTATION=+
MTTNQLETQRCFEFREFERNSLNQLTLDVQLQNIGFNCTSLSVHADSSSIGSVVRFPLEKLSHLVKFELTNVCVEIDNITAIIRAAKELKVVVLKRICSGSVTSSFFPIYNELSPVHISIRCLFEAIGGAPLLEAIDLSDNHDIFTIPHPSNASLYHEARSQYVESLCIALFKPSREYRLCNCNLGEVFLNKIGLLSTRSLFGSGSSGENLTIHLQNNGFTFYEVWGLLSEISGSRVRVVFDRETLRKISVDELWSIVTEKYDADILFEDF